MLFYEWGSWKGVAIVGSAVVGSAYVIHRLAQRRKRKGNPLPYPLPCHFLFQVHLD